MSEEDSEAVLRVQTVLYGNDQRQVWTLCHSLCAAARLAIAAGSVDRVDWAMGDCSPAPVMTDADADAIAAQATEAGLGAVTYDYFDENLGSSGGHNRLATWGTGRYLMTLNPDTYVAPRAITELVAALDNPTVAIAEARQIPLEHPKQFHPVSGDTSWSSTCCIIVRRSVFDDLGGFDHDHFPLYCDDVDFSWRARLAGHRVVVAPRATVFHDKRPSPDGGWPASDTEVFHSTLGRMMLATRFGRPDIVDETVRWIQSAGSPPQVRALAEFRRRQAAGELPEEAPDAERVAQFVDGEYAVHRF